MPTLRAAAELLTAANSLANLEPIAAAVGCAGPPAPLDRDTLHSIGLSSLVLDARIASGAGALRALLVQVDDAAALHDHLPKIAAQLASKAPHVLWLLLCTQPSSEKTAIAAWTPDRRSPRLTALIVDRAHVVDSDAETLRALAAAHADRDVLTHTRWVETLGRTSLTNRFYRALERAVDDLAQSSTVGQASVRQELALLDTSRLLFLCFLEAKGWLDGDAGFLAHQFDRCMTHGGRFRERILRPLFFGTLNTPIHKRASTARRLGAIPFLNGGLFARTSIERSSKNVVFSDQAYGALLGDVFARYRFTAREASTAWHEAAVDPEMLGKAFESLMASAERKRTGSFYTPFSLVEHITELGIETALETRPLADLTVLDPACGSGAFLVHALERIAGRLTTLGDPRDLATIRRDVLVRSIFGVDVNPVAVWLCQLRLWLSVVIESDETDPHAVPPLPNLDRNVRVGDALTGPGFIQGESPTALIASPARTLRQLRRRYANASGPHKMALARQLDSAERRQALYLMDRELLSLRDKRIDLLSALRDRDLFGQRQPDRALLEDAHASRRSAISLRATRRRIALGGALPFSFPVHFAEVAARGGFSLVIGNPPWIRLHHIPAEKRGALRAAFSVARSAAWEPGAAPAGASRGFASQVDVAALFVERTVQVLAPNGTLALLLPVKLWRSLAGGGVRALLGDATSLRTVEDHSEAASNFDAAVYPSVVVATRTANDEKHDRPSRGTPTRIEIAVHHRGHAPFTWCSPRRHLALDRSPGAPWLLLPPEARRAFDRIRAAGVPLATSPIGRPHLGVKCGCNEAFVVSVLGCDRETVEVITSTGDTIQIERGLLRPLLRGEQLRRWNAPRTLEHLIWTHDSHDHPLALLPPHTAKWLGKWRRTLQTRADAKHRGRWWALFRTESARFDRPRVVWGDVGREPRASVILADDDVAPLNTCYVTRCPDERDADALATLLNGPLARSWLDALAEPARGGYRRYLGWTVSMLPLPNDWRRARSILAPIGERARQGHVPPDGELLDAAADAYGLSRDSVAPLVAWTAP